MTVESILRKKGRRVATIRSSASVSSAGARMRALNIAALVVMSGDCILGVISEREIVHALSRHGDRLPSMMVSEIVAQRIVTALPQDSLKRVMALMTQHRVRHLPVICNGKLAGIVSIGDVVKHRLYDLELEANVLRDVYIAAR
jgi:CBS domain-containing protein